MDVCDHFSVNGQSTLFVTGIEDIYTDKEIEQVFLVYGSISQIVRIPHGRVLIKYSTDKSITKIDPIVLGKIASPNDPNMTWHVSNVRNMNTILYQVEYFLSLLQ